MAFVAKLAKRRASIHAEGQGKIPTLAKILVRVPVFYRLAVSFRRFTGNFAAKTRFHPYHSCKSVLCSAS